MVATSFKVRVWRPSDRKVPFKDILLKWGSTVLRRWILLQLQHILHDSTHRWVPRIQSPSYTRHHTIRTDHCSVRGFYLLSKSCCCCRCRERSRSLPSLQEIFRERSPISPFILLAPADTLDTKSELQVRELS